jgi:hypothetical protein
MIDKTINQITDTKNDEILKPLFYYIFNSIFFVMPVALSYVNEVKFHIIFIYILIVFIFLVIKIKNI